MPEFFSSALFAWLCFAGVFIWLSCMVHTYNSGYLPTAILTLAAIAFFAIWGPLVAFWFLVANIWLFLLGIALYLVIGGFWAVYFKWPWYVQKEVEDALSRLERDGGVNYEYIAENCKPDWRVKKDDIAVWWIYWPFSVVGYVLADFVYDGIMWVINCFGAVMQAYVDKVWVSVEVKAQQKVAEKMATQAKANLKAQEIVKGWGPAGPN